MPEDPPFDHRQPSQHDVMMVLYCPGRGARPEPNATSCLRTVAALEGANR